MVVTAQLVEGPHFRMESGGYITQKSMGFVPVKIRTEKLLVNSDRAQRLKKKGFAQK